MGINIDHALVLMDQIEDRLQGLQGLSEADMLNTADKSSRKAEVARRLLYAAHLAHMVEADIISQYHAFRGENVPLIIPSPTEGTSHD